MLTRNTEDAPGDHATGTNRSACPDIAATLSQSVRCTDTPLPRVTNPVISSPGTGVQQRASLTQTSPSCDPMTVTPASDSARWRSRGMACGVTPSAASSDAAAEPPAVAISRWMTVCGLIRPSPIEA